MVITSVSLCEQCENYDYQYTKYIHECCEDAGEKLTCIWCAASDQPEDERWHSCPNYKEYESEQV